MNIWSLDKDPIIKRLLLRLQEHFGNTAFHLTTPQETNHLSVRITPADESMTIYLYCYGQNPNCYGVHFEYISSETNPTTIEEENYDDIPYNRLIEMLSLHLF